MAARQPKGSWLICPDKTRLQTPLNVMNDDILRSIYSVCPEVSDISGKRRFHFFGCGLLIVSRSKPSRWRSLHDLYHHMPGVIIHEVSLWIFAVGIYPFAIRIMLILAIFEGHYLPGPNQVFCYTIGR